VLNPWYAGKINLLHVPFYDFINFSENLFADQVISVCCEIWPSSQRANFMSHTLLQIGTIEERKRMSA
jgi:hypothetical protein